MLGPKKSFVTLLDEQLLDHAEKEKEKRGMYPLRPSSAGKCGRKLAHELMAYEGFADKMHEVRKPHVIRLLSLGHAVEYNVLNHLSRITGYSLRFKQQVVSLFKLPSGRIVEGSMDAVLWSEEDRGVADVKSVGSRFTRGFNTSWDEDHYMLQTMKTVQVIDTQGYWVEDLEAFLAELGEHAIADNVAQINAYIFSDFMQERGILWGSVIQYEKSRSNMREIRFKPSRKMFDALKAKYSAIENAVAEKKPELIRKDFALGSQACCYCPYVGQCYPEAQKWERFKGSPKKNWAVQIEDLEGKQALRELFGPYLQALAIGESADRLAQKIILDFDAHGISRLKIDDGTVWEVVQLKSPKPHQVLRRGKE